MKIPRSLLTFLAIVSLIVSVGCQQAFPSIIPGEPSTAPITTTEPVAPSNPSPIPSATPTTTAQQIKVSFIDVGQADCTLFQYGNSSMIIDAGGNDSAGSLVAVLKKMNITKFDVVIGTHPHEDHIGGLDAVINNFNVGIIYMPKVSNNTKTFEDVLLAIKNKGLTVNTPVPGASFALGKDVQCMILAPNSSSYPELNSYSIVIRMTFNGKSFIFTGDAETDSEKEMLAKGYNLKTDVLKIGHHGSTSSTSPEFLKAVSPAFAVIFVGKDNTYGHPHQETLNKLNAAGVKTYRTDLNGTVTITVSGADISIITEK